MDVKFSEREEGRVGLGRSPGRKETQNNQGKKNPAQAWGGLRPQALQAKLGWDIRGSPGVHTAPSPFPEAL